MAAKRDMRRQQLIVPYSEPENKDSNDFQSTMSSTLPMAAMFTRNKLLGWTSVLFALQTWLAETPAQKAASSSPAYFQVLMALLSLGVGYMPLFMPPTPGRPATSSGPPAPAP
ncbi:uncharacterized protein MYCFIDRAFT_181995 [Pseudocercospora fijiensis CIRAD86]|uniref:Uncharacterized protein n=1 Tax=Pseudocercospora fijiensis (strain CIRAD86) TaxID=383855 RepID=M3A626_PSEFD|nr:uncharacterized protein MYCFIDRAFT_181995 [Pseudocercospora fijiensis CIRAD86]EME86569.1 hypothetical protein MYCFIDRAFT_181995 [Pseudocercospora fijiensis CIRAD86]